MGKKRDNTCEICGTTFVSGKNARWCPDCNRKRAYEKTRSFLRNHPEYRRRKVNECRARLRQGILLDPVKSAAIHQARILASATREGWTVEFSYLAGKWKWAASKDGARLVSGREFDDFNEARKDFWEAIF